jgi:hypothetical protein
VRRHVGSGKDRSARWAEQYEHRRRFMLLADAHGLFLRVAVWTLRRDGHSSPSSVSVLADRSSDASPEPLGRSESNATAGRLVEFACRWSPRAVAESIRHVSMLHQISLVQQSPRRLLAPLTGQGLSTSLPWEHGTPRRCEEGETVPAFEGVNGITISDSVVESTMGHAFAHGAVV